MKKVNRTTLFLLLTFGISYTLAAIFKTVGWGYNDSLIFTIFGIVYMFIPALCVVIVEKVIHKEKLNPSLLISFKFNKWFLYAWLIMPAISFLTLGISLLFPGVTYSSDMAGMIERYENLLTPEQIEQMKISLKNLPVHPIFLTTVQGLIAGATINAVVAFGEELGWRGFLLREFKAMHFLKASLVIGFIWGIWHAPIILMGHNYPQHPAAGVLMMTILCILLTPLFLYITIKSKSVIAAAIIHGTLNGTAGISILVISGGNDLTTGLTGLAGFTALIISLLILYLYDSKLTKEKIITSKMANWL